jgi:hypothetical protein
MCSKKATLVAFFIDFLSLVIYNALMKQNFAIAKNISLCNDLYAYERDSHRGLCL